MHMPRLHLQCSYHTPHPCVPSPLSHATPPRHDRAAERPGLAPLFPVPVHHRHHQHGARLRPLFIGAAGGHSDRQGGQDLERCAQREGAHQCTDRAGGLSGWVNAGPAYTTPTTGQLGLAG